MTTYTTLSNTTLAQNKPGTQSVFRALRDNPLAIAEGTAGAPKVQSKALDAIHFKAYTTYGGELGATSGIGGNELPLPLAQEAFDSDGLYNTGTYRFIPNEAGIYILQATVNLKTTISGGHTQDIGGTVAIRKNGTPIASAILRSTAQNEYASYSLSALTDANGSSDYFDLFYDWGGTGGAAYHAYCNGIGMTFFQGWQLSAE